MLIGVELMTKEAQNYELLFISIGICMCVCVFVCVCWGDEVAFPPCNVYMHVI